MFEDQLSDVCVFSILMQHIVRGRLRKLGLLLQAAPKYVTFLTIINISNWAAGSLLCATGESLSSARWSDTSGSGAGGDRSDSVNHFR